MRTLIKIILLFFLTASIGWSQRKDIPLLFEFENSNSWNPRGCYSFQVYTNGFVIFRQKKGRRFTDTAEEVHEYFVSVTSLDSLSELFVKSGFFTLSDSYVSKFDSATNTVTQVFDAGYAEITFRYNSQKKRIAGLNFAPTEIKDLIRGLELIVDSRKWNLQR